MAWDRTAVWLVQFNTLSKLTVSLPDIHRHYPHSAELASHTPMLWNDIITKLLTKSIVKIYLQAAIMESSPKRPKDKYFGHVTKMTTRRISERIGTLTEAIGVYTTLRLDP